MNVEKRKENFIYKSNLKHNYKFDYSKSMYINNYTKVVIICPKHGDFEQVPYSHIEGSGCNNCFIENKTTKVIKFIEQSKEIHGNKYDYSLVTYDTALVKVSIICHKHGEFRITPNKHTSRKQGCPKCSTRGFKPDTKENFIIKSIKVHGNKYNYSLVEYKKS